MLDISTNKIRQVVAFGHEMNRAEGELRGFLDGLNEDELRDLVAVMWIGRGSFAPEDLGEAIATAAQERTTPTADYLIGTPHFPDHLEAGMEALGLDDEDDGVD